MANGRVITGFSKPYVARYSASGTTVTYSGCMPLARGVEVSLEPESSDDNTFYADNVAAESADGVFTGGTLTLTVDGLFAATKRFVFGYPEAGADGWTADGDSTAAPYIGVGYIVRYMSDGVTTYVPTVIAKTKFSLPTEEAATQEDEIDWQTTELEATLMRDDTANHNWRFIGADFTTEAEAEAALITKLGGSTTESPKLSALTIGELTLTPAFDADTTTYTATTTNTSDVITAVGTTGATITITNGETAVTNGEAATWSTGSNTVTIKIENAGGDTTYTVTVTKSE